MIGNHTKAAIAALLAVDESATDEERTAVVAAASGQWRALTIVEAARRLGCARPKVYKLIREGLLATTPDGNIAELELSRFLATGIKAGRGAA
jgi:excisionase family DNA binding protein